MLIKFRGWCVRVKDYRNGLLERNCPDRPARRRETQGYDPDERENIKGRPAYSFPTKANLRAVEYPYLSRKSQDGCRTRPGHS